MKNVIKKDAEKLRNAQVGGHSYSATKECFQLSSNNVYIYLHSDYAAVSCVKLSELEICFPVTTEKLKASMPRCDSQQHNLLLPFFYCNITVL